MSNDDQKTWMWEFLPDVQSGLNLIGRLFDVTRPTAVFSEPVTTGETTIITASELNVGMGFGYGGGGGYGTMPETEIAASAQTAASGNSSGFGNGGGGGGAAGSRPIAAIIIQGDNVRVEPIVDATKIALAFLTTLGTIFALGAKIRAGGKRIA